MGRDRESHGVRNRHSGGQYVLTFFFEMTLIMRSETGIIKHSMFGTVSAQLSVLKTDGITNSMPSLP